MIKLVLLRHGESLWNRENRFTGWTDIDLSEKGKEEAIDAANLLMDAGFTFDIAFTSVLKRAIRTLWIVLDEMDLMWLPVHHTWRLNERHYGSLQGLNKVETALKYGEEQVHIWRRSYDIPPPELKPGDPRLTLTDPRYSEIREGEFPFTESLKETVKRFVPYWESTLKPELKNGKKVIIAAHGNSIRALVKHLDSVPDDKIVGINIPTGIPLIYEMDNTLKPIRSYYLGDQDKVKAAIEGVANQGRSSR